MCSAIVQVALLRGHVLELEERLRVLQALQATQTLKQANGQGPKEGPETEGTGVAAAALEKRCATLLNQQVAVHTILESKIKVRRLETRPCPGGEKEYGGWRGSCCPLLFIGMLVSFVCRLTPLCVLLCM